MQVAWNGKHYLLARADTRSPDLGAETDHIRIVRISPAMAVLYTEPIVIAGKQGRFWSPVVASNGRDFMITWSEDEYYPRLRETNRG